MSSWSVFDMNPLSDTLFANIFAHSVCFLLVLCMVGFAVENLFGWMESFGLVCFCFPCLRRPIQKNIAKIDVKECTSYVF